MHSRCLPANGVVSIRGNLLALGIDDAISAVSTTIGKAIDRIWPNPSEEAAAKVGSLPYRQLRKTNSLH